MNEEYIKILQEQNDRKAVTLGRFCGLAEFLKDNPIPPDDDFIRRRLIDILNDYREESCKR